MAAVTEGGERRTVAVNGERLALCLSGGGFRASVFHLGVLRRLWELGILGRVTTLSSVSGGSILAGFVADAMCRHGWASLADVKDWEHQVAAPFRAFVSRDLCTWPILAHALWSWAFPGPRAGAMVRRYRTRLSGRSLREIPDSPRFVFCATDVAFGVSWIFTRARVGDWRAGYVRTPPSLPLAYAVAASACFPPVFGPMRVPIPPEEFRRGRYREADRDRIMRRVALSDGGVYDNLGLEPALRNHHTAIVSDAGAPFEFRVSGVPIWRYMRYPGLLGNQVASLRLRQLMALIDPGRRACPNAEAFPDCRRRRLSEPCPHAGEEGCRDASSRPQLTSGLYLAISKDAASFGAIEAPHMGWTGYPAALVRTRIARVRTHLDRFTEAEQHVLENHGYSLAEAGLRQRLPHLIRHEARRFSVPHPGWTNPTEVDRALASSHRRLSLTRLLGLR
ncbi:MAG: patatin-like phospholipase family protein [Thermoanaerobaculaceae bacterium]